MIEFFVAWYSGYEVEQEYFWNRVFGPVVVGRVDHAHLQHGASAVALLAEAAAQPTWLFILSIFINIGMWFERFVIIVPSLSHEFEPWQWSGYARRWVDYAILLGSFGWFFMWFLLFIKQLPVIAIAEVKEIVPRRCESPDPGGSRSRPTRGLLDPMTPGETTDAGRHRSLLASSTARSTRSRSCKKRSSATSPSTRRRRATRSRTRCRRRPVRCGASR